MIKAFELNLELVESVSSFLNSWWPWCPVSLFLICFDFERNRFTSFELFIFIFEMFFPYYCYCFWFDKRTRFLNIPLLGSVIIKPAGRPFHFRSDNYQNTDVNWSADFFEIVMNDRLPRTVTFFRRKIPFISRTRTCDWSPVNFHFDTLVFASCFVIDNLKTTRTALLSVLVWL